MLELKKKLDHLQMSLIFQLNLCGLWKNKEIYSDLNDDGCNPKKLYLARIGSYILTF